MIELLFALDVRVRIRAFPLGEKQAQHNEILRKPCSVPGFRETVL
jgi:hypothetical protein